MKRYVVPTAAVICAFDLLATVLLLGFSEKLQAAGGVSLEYEQKLFDQSKIISVNIIMDPEKWSEMLANAAAEQYYECDVEINGTIFRSVSIRPKGNTSLSAIVRDADCDRYSFKLEFGHYIEGQTCFGLDKLILNNNYADATNMKEAVAYNLFSYIGADASLCNYANISLNSEYWGVYFALEAVEESFILRNYGTQNGNLYKPESLGGGRQNAMPKNGGFNHREDMPRMPDGFVPHGDAAPDDFVSRKTEGAPAVQEGAGAMLNDAEAMRGGSTNGADLNYSDDELASYQAIWDGEANKTGKADHKRVIEALKNIAEGTDIEKYMDVDNILKYMAVHTFVVNDDSLSGNMSHNYYLYEYNGRLNILPWDYNLSFSGMRGGDASSMINDAIYTPFTITDFFDAIIENEEYLAKYHEYLQKITDYAESGGFDTLLYGIISQISELVKTDPNALYDYDEYEAAAEMLRSTLMLRSESVKGQLDGSIPSTDEGQKIASAALVDASAIDVSVMGTFMNGVIGGGFDLRQQNTEAQTAQQTRFPQNAPQYKLRRMRRKCRPRHRVSETYGYTSSVLLLRWRE